MLVDEEFMRLAVQLVKERFVRWRNPPIELPAESVIYAAVAEVIETYERRRAASQEGAEHG